MAHLPKISASEDRSTCTIQGHPRDRFEGRFTHLQRADLSRRFGLLIDVCCHAPYKESAFTVPITAPYPPSYSTSAPHCRHSSPQPVASTIEVKGASVPPAPQPIPPSTRHSPSSSDGPGIGTGSATSGKCSTYTTSPSRSKLSATADWSDIEASSIFGSPYCNSSYASDDSDLDSPVHDALSSILLDQ
ncbi:hypothetical protein C8Q76DRAFT_803788 [Earliella scabrosa]|nr:hypothetical protein C8Q76DRAFT_803788 [Earliella scabrosa]